MPAAQAADLGGNCCADLEERVAELEATTVRKGNRKVSLTISGHVNRAILFWDDGFESDVYSVDNAQSTSRFRFVGTARISPAVTAGFQTEWDIAIGARNDAVNQIDDDGVNTNNGGGLGAANFGDGLGGAGDSVLRWRLANWFLEHKEYGRVTVGRLNTAASGASSVDLGGIGVVTTGAPGYIGGGFFLRNGAGILSSDSWSGLCAGSGGAGAGGPYSSECSQHDSVRKDAVRYDTPTWMGFTIGASWGEDDYWDVALRYAGEFSGFRLAGAIAYSEINDQEADLFNDDATGQVRNTDRHQWRMSASVLHVPSGIFVDAAYMQYQFHGTNEFEINQLTGANRPDVNLWWVAAGISKNWFGIGKTVPYVEYGKVTDGITGTFAVDTNNVEGTLEGLGASGVVIDSDYHWWGLGLVQNVDAAAMELYLVFRHYSADVVTTGTQVTGGLEDINFVMGGARIQF